MMRTSKVAGVAIFFLLLTTASSDAADRPEFDFDGRDWLLGFQGRCGAMQIEEFVLRDESVCCWSELVTWQYFAGWHGRESTREIMRQLRHQRMIQSPTVEWEILAEGFNSVLYAWGIENDRTVRNHFELTRIIKTHEGLHVFRYAALDREIFSEHLDAWIESFENVETSW